MQLNLLVSPTTDPNHTQRKSFGDNCGKINNNINNKVNSDKLLTKEEFEVKEQLRAEDLEGFKQSQWKHKKFAVNLILKLLKCIVLGKVTYLIFLIKKI